MSSDDEDFDPDCVFCGQNPRTVWTDGVVFVCSDPAPLAPGHLLVVPHAHHPSAADTPRATLRRIDQIIEALGGRMSRDFGPYAVFEHGRTGHCIRSSQGERLCHHAHIHLVPSSDSLVELVDLGQRVPFESWADIPGIASETDGYVALATEAGAKYLHPVTRPLPPHHLRTLLATAMGHPERADWEVIVGATGAASASPDSHEAVVALVADAELDR